ncbi:MAG: hypothetical protein J1E96_05095 [Ruminococcus sp.]|nr:hypothetical protein [Ruminococcus sp.]
MKIYCSDEKYEKFLYTDFVRDLREDKSVPFIRFPDDYNGEKIAKLCCTQHTNWIWKNPDYQRKKITDSWCRFFSEKSLPLEQVQFCTRTPQKVLDSFSNQSNVTSLRFKWLACKDITSLGKMKNLKELFIEDGSSIEDISPLAELENLEVLILGSTKKIINYSVIGNLKNLKVLGICTAQSSINETVRIESDEFIRNLNNLRYLNLWHDAYIENNTYLSPETLKDLDYYRYSVK